jgi:hypothetical protein
MATLDYSFVRVQPLNINWSEIIRRENRRLSSVEDKNEKSVGWV